MSWLCVAIALVETLICFKMGKGMFPAPHPKEVVYPWAAFTVCFILWALFHYGWYNKTKSSSSVANNQFLVKGGATSEENNQQDSKKKKKSKSINKDE
jgi:hypothetical protein